MPQKSATNKKPVVGVDTLKQLRSRYLETWKISWPENNKYLSELWLEARVAQAETTARVPTQRVWAYCLDLMRETHEIPAEVEAATAG